MNQPSSLVPRDSRTGVEPLYMTLSLSHLAIGHLHGVLFGSYPYMAGIALRPDPVETGAMRYIHYA